MPLLLQEGAGGGWQRGLGDVAVAVKHALFHSLDRGNIFSVAGEVVLPTGKESASLGSGVTIFEPFVAFGQILPADGFLQLQAGLELPVDSARAVREAFCRTALGKTFTEGRLGRSWSPMFELLCRARPGTRSDYPVGSGAADAGHAQPPAAHHDKRRVAIPAQRSQRAEPASDHVLPVGLVRWRPAGRLAMRATIPRSVLAGRRQARNNRPSVGGPRDRG